MIFHERAKVSTGAGQVISESLPCEVVPVRSELAHESGPPKISYTLLWRGVPTIPAGSRVVHRGDEYTVEAKPESHYVRGRLHHAEAVMVDYLDFT